MISLSDFADVVQTLAHAVASFGALIVTTFFGAFFDAVMMEPFDWAGSVASATSLGQKEISYKHPQSRRVWLTLGVRLTEQGERGRAGYPFG